MPSGKRLDPAPDFKPLPISPQSMTVVRRGLVSAYENTSRVHRELGRQFYPKAHEEAGRVGRGNVEKGAGVIAALSPGADYYQVNVPAAHEAVSHLTDRHVAALRSGDRSVLEGDPHFRALSRQSSDNIVKAHRIMAGEHPDTVLGPLKTNDFHHTIVDPSTQGHYTMDTIMHDEAFDRPMQWKVNRGLTGTVSKKTGEVGGRYGMMKTAGLQAARDSDVDPSVHQASVWFRGQERRGRTQEAPPAVTRPRPQTEEPTGQDRVKAEAQIAAIQRNVRRKRGIPTAQQLGNQPFEGWG